MINNLFDGWSFQIYLIRNPSSEKNAPSEQELPDYYEHSLDDGRILCLKKRLMPSLLVGLRISGNNGIQQGFFFPQIFFGTCIVS